MAKKTTYGLRGTDLAIISVAVVGIFTVILIFPVDEIFKVIERENIQDIDLDINEEALEDIGQAIKEADTASIIDDPIVIPISNQTLIDLFLESLKDEPETPPDSDQNPIEQFFDENEPIGITASPKVGIAVDVTLIDSNFKRIDVPTNFLNIPTTVLPLTLLDAEGRIFDLGSITIGFTAVSNIDAVHDVTGKFVIIINTDEELNKRGELRERGKIITTQEFFGRGTPDADNKLKLQTTGGKDAITFIFKDEPPSAFIAGTTLDNRYDVFIKEVSVTVGEGFDTVVHGFKGNFNAYTLRLQFDKDGVVVRDNTGKAISVFPSDSTITECGQNKAFANGFVSGKQKVWSPTGVTVQVLDDVNGLVLVTSANPVYGNQERDFWKRVCSEKVSGIPRNSELIFRVNGQDVMVMTKKTQQNFIIACEHDLAKTLKRLPPICASNFGFIQGTPSTTLLKTVGN